VAVFESVTKTYRDPLRLRSAVPALRGVSFQVQRGEVFGLLGPNRAGKTTLLKILLSLCRPTSGNVLRLGRPLSDRSTLARVGFMHENQVFPRYHTATSLLRDYGELTGLNGNDVAARLPRLLQRVGLADRAHEPIARFSKGMFQRLALAQALVNDPELLVFDEPTEGLDLDGRRLIYEVAAEQRKLGRTVLLVSHVFSDVERLCDRVAVLLEGRLAHVGPLDELRRDPDSGEERPLERALEAIYDRRKSS
jgi:ABC-2 type transport system ATP-binding protein